MCIYIYTCTDLYTINNVIVEMLHYQILCLVKIRHGVCSIIGLISMPLVTTCDMYMALWILGAPDRLHHCNTPITVIVW
jgi:hypothetical protein